MPSIDSSLYECCDSRRKQFWKKCIDLCMFVCVCESNKYCFIFWSSYFLTAGKVHATITVVLQIVYFLCYKIRTPPVYPFFMFAFFSIGIIID